MGNQEARRGKRALRPAPVRVPGTAPTSGTSCSLGVPGITPTSGISFNLGVPGSTPTSGTSYSLGVLGPPPLLAPAAPWGSLGPPALLAPAAVWGSLGPPHLWHQLFFGGPTTNSGFSESPKGLLELSGVFRSRSGLLRERATWGGVLVSPHPVVMQTACFCHTHAWPPRDIHRTHCVASRQQTLPVAHRDTDLRGRGVHPQPRLWAASHAGTLPRSRPRGQVFSSSPVGTQQPSLGRAPPAEPRRWP